MIIPSKILISLSSKRDERLCVSVEGQNIWC